MDKVMRNKKVIIVFIAPAMILFTLIIPVPLVVSMGLSFFKWNLLEAPQFIGLDNFIRLFTKDAIFLTSVKNTLIYILQNTRSSRLMNSLLSPTSARTGLIKN